MADAPLAGRPSREPEPAPIHGRHGRPVRLVEGVERLHPGDGRLFVVVGVFDGIHRGHAYLIRALLREARRRAARPTVLTFDAHPDEIIAGRAPAVLLDPEERLARLARAGVEVVVVAHFDARVRTTPYDVFVRSIGRRVDLAGFLMTPDAAFGYERRGTPEAIARLGADSRPPFDVAVVPPLRVDGRPMSSGAIRAAIAAGDLDGARRMLGRRVAVTGRLAAGPARGPAAVVFDVPVALPPPGRYMVRVGRAWSLDGGAGGGAAWRRATVTDGRLVLDRRPWPGDAGRVRVAFAGPAD